MEKLFYLSQEKENLNKLHLNLVYITKNSTDPTWHSTLHVHPFTELFYVLDGAGSMKFQHNTEIPLSKDDLLIVNSNIYHTEAPLENQSLSYMVLGVRGVSILPMKNNTYPLSNDENPMDSYILHHYVYHNNFKEHRDQLLSILYNLYEEQNEQGAFYEDVSHHLLQIFLLSIIRFTETKLVLGHAENPNPPLEYVKSYIDLYYNKDIHLEELAKIVFINKYQLVREFKKNFSMTPIDYLVFKRIKIAKDLLENTNHSIQDIANIVGFHSASYFTRIFKKKTNSTPRAYRKNKQKK